MEQEPGQQQWYTRRDGVIRGPFAAQHITRYILLGRIRLEDELSRDSESWSPAGQLTSLLPEELLNLSGWDDYQKLVVARLQADERKGERRCQHCKNRDNCRERRLQAERREGPAGIPVEFLNNTGQGNRRTPRQAQLRPLLLALLLASMLLAWLVPTLR